MQTPDDHFVKVVLGQEGYQTKIQAGNHQLVADEPVEVGGQDTGTTPYGLLLSSLGACTAMTLRMYANRKEWPLEKIEVSLSHTKDYYQDCLDCEKTDTKIDIIERVIQLHGDLDEKQIKRLMNIANKCPVHKTLTTTTVINTHLADEAVG